MEKVNKVFSVILLTVAVITGIAWWTGLVVSFEDLRMLAVATFIALSFVVMLTVKGGNKKWKKLKGLKGKIKY